MTTTEFSNQFDILWNNIMSNQAPGLDEYEKSVFLTDAQEQVVLTYYGGRPNSAISFELTEEIRRYLGSLVKTVELSPVVDPEDTLLTDKSQVFNLPEKLWFITYESAKLQSDDDSCIDGKMIEVTPVTQDAFHRTAPNPFKGPNSRRALRLDIGDRKVELVSDYNIDKYLVRYVEKLSPIILTDLGSGGLSIRGKTTAQTCALNDAVHSLILTTAVSLARDAMGKTFVKSQQ